MKITKADVSEIRKQAREDAKTGNFRPDDHGTNKLIYACCFFAAEDKKNEGK